MDIGTIMRRITGRCPAASYLFIPVLQAKDRLQGGGMRRYMRANIDRFCTPAQRNDPAYMRRTRRDMWYCFVRYHIDFEEYFMYEFPRLSHQARREFVTEAEKTALCEKLSPREVWEKIWDKWSAYELFRAFYRRDAVKVDGEADYQDFAAFVKKHPRFIAKPRLESCGIGVTIFDTAREDTDIRELFARLRDNGVICEELIVQAEPLAGLHPGSVNTVRVATMVKDGAPEILFTFLRMGRGASIVDNAGAGGFVAAIDAGTGIVMTPGTTETHETALTHPDTGAQILGLRIPRWEELLDTARQAAMTYPAHPYISWDFALTEGGWVVVEANCMGQFICPQFTTGHGIRSRLRPYFDL